MADGIRVLYVGGEPDAGGVASGLEAVGFGLAIVNEITRAHGWSIRTTESAAGGARFEVATGGD